MKRISLYTMSLLYVAAGCNHFIHPRVYLAIMPPYLPWHRELVMISGIAEVALGLLLLPVITRRMAAYGIVFLLIAVFPANLQMWINYKNSAHLDTWMALARLPVQIALLIWAWSFTKN